MASSDDLQIALQQFIKSKRTEARLRFALIADAEIARLVPKWRAEFYAKADLTKPEVYDFDAETKRRADVKLLDA